MQHDSSVICFIKLSMNSLGGFKRGMFKQIQHKKETVNNKLKFKVQTSHDNN